METSRLSLPQAVSFRKTTDGIRKERIGCDPDVESGFSKELTFRTQCNTDQTKPRLNADKGTVRFQAHARKSHVDDLTFVLNGVIEIVELSKVITHGSEP